MYSVRCICLILIKRKISLEFLVKFAFIKLYEDLLDGWVFAMSL